MNHDAIVEAVIDLLRHHQDGSRGSIHQEPYKGDFFKLFAAAFNAGLIESTSQADYVSADADHRCRCPRPEVLTSATWENLRMFWQEWTYAWRHCNQKR
jgi:hypothetical protein